MKLSAVVQLIDGFSQMPAVGIKPGFLLDQQPCQPLIKGDGFYAFSDLPDGVYQLTVIDQAFFVQQLAFQVPLRLPLAQAIIPCYLAPSPLYPYPPETTMIRGLVVAAGSAKPLAGVSVGATYANWRAKTKTAATLSWDMGRYDGRYALALGGKLARNTEVMLSFSKTGYTSVEKQINVAAATMQFVDIEMHSCTNL